MYSLLVTFFFIRSFFVWVNGGKRISKSCRHFPLVAFVRVVQVIHVKFFLKYIFTVQNNAGEIQLNALESRYFFDCKWSSLNVARSCFERVLWKSALPPNAFFFSNCSQTCSKLKNDWRYLRCVCRSRSLSTDSILPLQPRRRQTPPATESWRVSKPQLGSSQRTKPL